ncbi:MAG: PAS domain S-box protein [Bacteroidota bacterium]|nr:PAS domain S-box protein [Bacteroidota bacterium]
MKPQKLRQERWLDILNALPDMCFIVSPDESIIEINERGKAILEKENKYLPNRSIKDYVNPAYLSNVEGIIDACIKDGSTHRMEAEFKRSNGDILNVELFLNRIILDQKRNERGCLIVAHDISDRKKQELDLLRFTNLAHYTVNPIEITDAYGHIIYVNPAFEKASGYTKEEVIGKNPNIFSSGKHPKSFWNKMWQTISAGKVWVGEVENKGRNGEPFYTQLLISPIVNTEGDLVGYFGIHRDISDQKYLEQQLIHAQKMESIGMLAAGLAHEVGNPLASISSLVQIIQRTSEDEFTQEKLELIKSQITRISRIIRDLVDFSRRSTYEVQLTDINKIIHDAIEIVRVSKKSKDIYFDTALDYNLPLLMLVPDQIQQVFINLMLNSVDALQDSQPTPLNKNKQKRISIKSALLDDSLLIDIEDNGKGIKQEDLSKIFEPFYTTKKVGEGTGLGLWVSYGIIKSFRGEIRVKSNKDVGALFTVRLPVQS